MDRFGTPAAFIIGAQKSGTTSFFHDLSERSGERVCFPGEKEPDILSTFWEGKDRAEAAYKAWVEPTRRLIDCSTTYSMRNRYEGVAARAASISPHAQVVYIVRDPVDRALSHYAHLVARKMTNRSLEEEWADPSSELRLHGKYAYQLEPWTHSFGDNVTVIEFERYVQNREDPVDAILRQVDLSPDLSADLGTVHHQTSTTPVPTGTLRKIHLSAAYRKHIRRMIPHPMRRLLVERIGNTPVDAPDVSPGLRATMYEYFQDDIATLNKHHQVGFSWGSGADD